MIIPLTALPNIDAEKSRRAQAVLDDLLVTSKTISGYNWYTSVPTSSRIVTFSHMHESDDYRKEMRQDLAHLGYTPEDIERRIRIKFSTFLWGPDFIFRNEKGELLTNLRIRRVK